MKQYARLLEEFLKETGRLPSGGPKLGGKPEAQVSDQQVHKLTERLLGEAKVNKTIIIVLVTLHVLLFLLASSLVVLYKDRLAQIRSVIGGSVLSFLVILTRLQGVWREKCGFDLLLATVPKLSAKDAANLVETIYFASKQRSDRKHKRSS